jgi:sarcosine oxidase
MTIKNFDTIVLGAGAMGSAAAYHLARDGQRVLLLEQFKLAHNRGSSHGESRIFRYAYPDLAYVRLAIQSKKLWRDLEADASEDLLRTIGGLDIGEGAAGRAAVMAVADSLRAAGSHCDQFNREELARRYPQWKFNDDDIIAVYSPDTGALPPTRCIEVITKQAAHYQAVIQDCEAAQRIDNFSDGVEVVTPRQRYRARHLIITAGAWSSHILKEFGLTPPLRVSQEQTVYFRPRTNAAAFAPDRFKIWIHYREAIVYGFPMLDAPGIKLGFHHDHNFINVEDYTQEPRMESVERLRDYLEQHLPDAAGEPFAPTTCLYTSTPDENFIVDTLPNAPHIALAAGFSGHGFKFAIGIGRALADLIERGHTEMEIGHLKLARFSHQ